MAADHTNGSDIPIRGTWLRRTAVRIVLAFGVLVMLGTSDADPPSLQTEASAEVEPDAALTLRVSAHPDAVRAHGAFFVTLDARADGPVDTVLEVVPRDPSERTAMLVLGDGAPGTAGAGSVTLDDPRDDAGAEPRGGATASRATSRRTPSASDSISIGTSDCPPDEPCERIYDVHRVDGPDDTGGTVELTARATIREQYPDRVFCASDVPSFGPRAALMVSLDVQ